MLRGVHGQSATLRHAFGALLGIAFGLAITSPVGVAALRMLPIISILTPTQNAQVSGQVTFYAAADSQGVVALRFQVDGQDLGSEITSGACEALWDSTAATDGLHTIVAVARDEFSNTIVSQPVTVFVNNFTPPAPPQPPAPEPGTRPRIEHRSPGIMTVPESGPVGRSGEDNGTTTPLSVTATLFGTGSSTRVGTATARQGGTSVPKLGGRSQAPGRALTLPAIGATGCSAGDPFAGVARWRGLCVDGAWIPVLWSAIVIR